VISVKDLSRKYGALVAVNSVSFEIPRGQIVGLLGHNGAGKTTTLKMLTGYLEPTAGTITIDGLNIADELRAVQSKIGYLSEQSPLYPEMPVWHYLEYVAELRGIPEHERESAIRAAILATDLQDKVGEVISTLSKGYRQRVGVAQAIIHKPEILILDEPTNGLDPSQILAMRNLIKSLSKTSTVIISTHIMQEVEAICDRVIIILKGQIAVDETIENLHKNKKIILGVTQNLAEVQSLTSQIKGISSVTLESQEGAVHRYSIEVETNASAMAPSIARSVLAKGWDLYQINSEFKNLESVFKEVNHVSGGNSHV
jgi:ABC-2 type transport system ATP-binding protein